MTTLLSPISLACLGLALSTLAVLQAAEPAAPYRVYLGTYTGGAGESKGIYTFTFNPATGEASPVTLAAEVTNPTFLALHPNRRALYSVSEIANFAGGKTGAVSAFAIAPESGALTLLNQQPSGGAGPCHLEVDHSGRCLLVANYSGGTVAAFPLAAEGRIEAVGTLMPHAGHSVHPQRQTKPYAHFIAPSPDNRFALACDLGADRVFVYALDAAKAGLAPHDPPSAALAPGAGPRHLAFHPNGRFALVVNELNSTVTSFAWDAARGTLKEIQSVPTLPAGFTNTSTTAEIEVHPNGRFVYASNRGHDSLAVFALDADTGQLSLVEIVPTGGKTPRCFSIGPDGKHLFAANQGSGNVVVFALDPATGRLRSIGKSVPVPSPVCVKFLAQ
jgi:6-phosphogluconolactonase